MTIILFENRKRKVFEILEQLLQTRQLHVYKTFLHFCMNKTLEFMSLSFTTVTDCKIMTSYCSSLPHGYTVSTGTHLKINHKLCSVILFTILICTCSSRKKGFRNLFTFTIKALKYTCSSRTGSFYAFCINGLK